MRSIPRPYKTIGLLLVAAVSSCKDQALVVIPVASVEITGATTLLAGSSTQYTAIPRDDLGNRLSSRTVQETSPRRFPVEVKTPRSRQRWVAW